MSSDKHEFYGKDVSEAIKTACETLNVPQEQLDIEVLETGTTGIFGLIRKKAHISVTVKPPVEEDNPFDVGLSETLAQAVAKTTPVPEPPPAAEKKKSVPKKVEKVERDEKIEKVTLVDDSDDDDDEDSGPEGDSEGVVSEESVAVVRAELLQLVNLMGFPSDIEIGVNGISVSCVLRGDFEEELAGNDGKVLDSLQYLLRKIVSRKIAERIRLSVNVGDFRERRLASLKEKALELAALVKSDGKTQVLAALNPSERRAIHMVLQEDKDIRSRSVGDGLFKKILIYKPGKSGRSGGRKRSQGRSRSNDKAQQDRRGNKNS